MTQFMGHCEAAPGLGKAASHLDLNVCVEDFESAVFNEQWIVRNIYVDTAGQLVDINRRRMGDSG